MDYRPERRYDVDWLRVIIVCVVLVHHGLLIYVQDPGAIVYVKDPSEDSALFAAIARFNRQFQMELLFLLAGFSVFFSLQTRNTATYLKERCLRLGVPFIAGSLTLVPLMTYFTMLSQNIDISFIDHYIGFFRLDLADIEGLTGTYTPAHLWFILFLFVLSLAALPLFLILKRPRGIFAMGRLAELFSKPFMLLLWALPLAGMDYLNVLGSKSPLVFLLMMVYGFMIASDKRYQRSIDKYLLVYIALAVITQATNNHLPFGERNLLIYNIGRWCWMLSFMGLAHIFLNKNSEVLKTLSAAGFPFYILHLPVMTILSYYIVRSNMNYIAEFFIIVILTAVITWFSYLLLRKTKLTRFLLGIKG